MQHDGKHHALAGQAGVAEQGFAQFQVAAGADREKFGQSLYDAENNGFQ